MLNILPRRHTISPWLVFDWQYSIELRFISLDSLLVEKPKLFYFLESGRQPKPSESSPIQIGNMPHPLIIFSIAMENITLSATPILEVASFK